MRPFLFALLLAWVALATAFLLLSASCRANPACSGESGIVFVILALPWIEHLPLPNTNLLVFIGLAINSILVATFVQLVAGWIAKRQR